MRVERVVGPFRIQHEKRFLEQVSKSNNVDFGNALPQTLKKSEQVGTTRRRLTTCTASTVTDCCHEGSICKLTNCLWSSVCCFPFFVFATHNPFYHLFHLSSYVYLNLQSLFCCPQLSCNHMENIDCSTTWNCLR